MKKLFLYVFLGLLFCNVGFADELSVNSLLQDGYKIIKNETKVADGKVVKIITLTKGKSYVICAAKIRGGTSVYISTTCEKP
tara:strand:+ start:1170 stop:1415 length:246 start_codon:yes stop_codon:yes gene_type:complete